MTLRERLRGLSRPKKVVLGLGGASLSTVAGVTLVTLQLVHGGPALPELPVLVGAQGPGWEVRDVDGVPVLLEGGLPYPSDFARADHPRQDLNGAWELRLDPDDAGVEAGWAQDGAAAGWEPTTVPGTYNAQAGPHADHEGVAWFRRRFRVDAAGAAALAAGGLPRLCFRGVLLRATVWLNGRELGSHEGGYTPFYLDLADALEPAGENLLVVRADNRLTWTSLPPLTREDHRPGWAAYGGIHRDVYLELLPAVHLAKLALTPGADLQSLAVDVVVDASRQADQAHRLRLALSDPDGQVVASAELEGAAGAALRGAHHVLAVPDPRRWSPADPALYTLRATLAAGDVEHDVAVQTGIRSVAVTADAGGQLQLNGEPIRLRGIAKHEDHPVHGQTQPPELLRSDLELLTAMNLNYVRVSHYPHTRAALEAMRDRGLLLMEEVPLYQAGMGFLGWAAWDGSPGSFPRDRFGLRQLHDRELLLAWQQQLLEMIERDRNNPAVAIWMVGNECYSLGEGVRPVYRWMKQVTQALDPSRPVSFAELTFSVASLDDRRFASAEMDLVSLNAYYGWYFATPAAIGPYLDRQHARFPDTPFMISEVGAGAALGRTDADGIWEGEQPKGRTYSEAYQAELLETTYRAAVERPWLAGYSPWVLADFRCPWFPKNPVAGYNCKGVVTRDREPKQGYRTLQRLYGEAE